MTPDEAFKKFLAAHEHNDLPWEMQEEEMRPTFMAGWHAHAESQKQTAFALEGESQVASRDAKSKRMDNGAALSDNDYKDAVQKTCAEVIYASYPRKIGKQSALKAITKAAKTVEWHALHKAVNAYAAAVARWPAAEKKFIPHPATWFNRGSYEDDPKEWQRGGGAFGSQFNTTRS